MSRRRRSRLGSMDCSRAEAGEWPRAERRGRMVKSLGLLAFAAAFLPCAALAAEDRSSSMPADVVAWLAKNELNESESGRKDQ